MFCINCGAANKDEAKLCINCGESLSEDSAGGTLSQSRDSRERTILKEINAFRPLFDFSFEQFASPNIMTFLYGLSILWAGLIAFFLVIIGFNVSRGLGILALFVGAPLSFLITVIYSRVFLEMILMIFRMEDHRSALPGNLGMTNREEYPESKDSIQWNI